MATLAPMRTDQELLAAYAAAGDDTVFAELVARHGRMVFRTCLRTLGSEHDAEEAAQAVFLVLIRKAKRLRFEGELAAWLHRVARNVAHLALRSRARRSRHEAEAAMAQAGGDEGRGAGGGTDRTEAATLLDRELDALPATQRQAVLLRYLEGLPQEEAARVAGCPQGTLARRAQLGLERLRERLARRGQVLSAAALLSLLGAEAAAVAPGTLLPSILAVSKLAASVAAGTGGGTASVMAEGVLKMMFWAKAKVVAAVAVVVLAVGGGGGAVAAKLLAGEPAGEKASPPRQGETPRTAPPDKPEKPAKETDPKAVDGIRLTISADKLEIKAGDEVKITAGLENVSKEALRVFKYYAEVSWELVAPDGESLQHVPYRGPMPGIAPPSDLGAFPEIAAGGTLDYPGNGISGNPPVIGVGGDARYTKVCLLKPGIYKLTAVYTNKTDTLWTKDFKGQQPVPGKVWKGTVRSNTLEFKLGGEFKAPAEAAPWPVGGIPGVTPPQKGERAAAGAPDEATARRLVLEYVEKVKRWSNVKPEKIVKVEDAGDIWKVFYDPAFETMPPVVFSVKKVGGAVGTFSSPGGK